MKQYKDLNLKAIRDKLDIDFAHFTYLRGQRSDCSRPTSFPKKYWKDGYINYGAIEFILFKNADNGSGIVTKNNYITDNTYIQWEMPMDKLKVFCEELQKQLDTDYLVLCPKDDSRCVCIKCKSEGLFKITMSEIRTYETDFDMTKIRALQVKDVKSVLCDNNFNIKGE